MLEQIEVHEVCIMLNGATAVDIAVTLSATEGKELLVNSLYIIPYFHSTVTTSFLQQNELLVNTPKATG